MWSRGSRRRRLASVQEILPLEEIAGDVVSLRGGDYRCGARGLERQLRAQVGAGAGGDPRRVPALPERTHLPAAGAGAPGPGRRRGLPRRSRGRPRGARRRCGGSRSTTRPSCGVSPASGRCSTAASSSSCRRKWTQHPGGPRRAGRAWAGCCDPARSPRGNRATSPGRAARSPSAAGEVAQGLGSFGVSTRRLGGEELAALWRATLGGVATGVTGGTAGREALVAAPVVTSPAAFSGRRQAASRA